jgi:hypothetical protein
MNNNSAHRAAMAKAVRVGADTFNAEVYKSMRNPLSAATYGVRPWPEHLTPENVASWIVSNVSYSTPWEAQAS